MSGLSAPARTPVDPEAATAADAAWRQWWPSLRYALQVFLVVRLGLFLVGLLAVGLLPSNKGTDVPGWPAAPLTGGWHNVFTAWERFDALWYLRIASAGYRSDDGSAAFFPLFPLLTRAVAVPLGRHWLLGAYVVSQLALVVALMLLHRLTAMEFGDRTARRTLVYLCVFPTGFFLFAPYSESLFLALSVGCLYAARRSAWLIAGVLGALASASRSAGLLLAVPLLVEGALQVRASSELQARLRTAAAACGAAALVPVGMGLYLAYWGIYGQDWRRPLEIQKANWSREFTWPWDSLYSGWQLGMKYIGSFPGGYHTLDLLIVAVAFAAAVWVALRLRATYSVYLGLSLVLPLLLTYGGRPFISMPRYLLVAVPIFWALTRFTERWRAHDVVVAAGAAGTGVMSLLFVNWYYIF